MTLKYEQHGVRWIDLENPTADEVHQAARDCDLSSRFAEELLSPSPLPLVLHDTHAVLLVLHFPALSNGKTDRASKQEIDFVVGRDFILTVRYEVIAPLHELRKTLEMNALSGHNGKVDTGALLELLFNRLFEGVRSAVMYEGKRLERVEQEMFSDKKRKTIISISEIGQQLLHLEASIAGGENALSVFLDETDTAALGGTHFKARIKRILNQQDQTLHLISTFRAIAIELRETNAALIEIMQNDIIRTLTVITFMVLPLGLIASIFELNVKDVPFAENPHGFWIVITMMLVVSGVAATFVFRKRWL